MKKAYYIVVRKQYAKEYWVYAKNKKEARAKVTKRIKPVMPRVDHIDDWV